MIPTISKKNYVSVCLYLLLLAIPGFADEVKTFPQYMGKELTVDLTGPWQVAGGDEKRTPDAKAYVSVEVPSFVHSVKNKERVEVKSYRSNFKNNEAPIDGVWYRREIDIPESWRKAGEILLSFDAVASQAVVFVNGKKAGQHVGGYDPFSFDIKPFTKTGANQIDVYCTYKTAPLMDLMTIRHPTRMGIWQGVRITALPVLNIPDVFVIPEPSKKQVSCVTEIKSSIKFNGTLRLTILDKNNNVLATADQDVAAKDPELQTVKMSLPGQKLKLWQLDLPTLYTLRAELLNAEGNVIHTRDVRFGYRSFEIKGRDFYLNGVKTRLRESCQFGFTTFRSPFLSAKDIRENIRKAKKWNVNEMRIHQELSFPLVMQIADEEGLLIIPEFSHLHHITPKKGDTAARDALGDQMAGLVRRFRNHPSVILWCLANEAWYQSDRVGDWRYQCYRYYKNRLAKLDPTRACFIAGASKGWPGTIGDHLKSASIGKLNSIVDCHYPAANRAMTTIMDLESYIQAYNRPVSCGELIYYSYPRHMELGDRLLGEPFAPQDQVRDRAGWYQGMITDAWRAAGAARYAIICGFTLFGNAKSAEKVYKSIRVSFAVDPGVNYWSDEPIVKTMTIINDSSHTLKAIPELRLADAKKQLAAVSIPPAESRRVQLTLLPQAVTKITNETFTASLTSADGTILDQQTHEATLWPASLKTTAYTNLPEYRVYDPSGKLLELLQSRNVPCQPVSSLEKLLEEPNVKIPAVAYLPRTKGLTSFHFTLTRYLSAGGRLLLLAPNLGYEMDSCFAWATSLEHPVFAGIPSKKMQFWRNGRYTLYDHFLPIPLGGRSRMLAEHRSAGATEIWWWQSPKQKESYALDGSVLTETLFDGGRLLLSTLRLIEHPNDPSANVLLSRLLSYNASPVPAETETLYIGGQWKDLNFGGEFIATPDDVQQRLFAGKEGQSKTASHMLPIEDKGSESADMKKNSLIIIGTNTVTLSADNAVTTRTEALKKFVRDGGTVLVLSQNPKTWTSDWLPEPIRLEKLSTPAQAAEVLPDGSGLTVGLRSAIYPRWKLEGEEKEHPVTSVYLPGKGTHWQGLLKPIGKLKPPFKRLDGFALVTLPYGMGRYILCQIDPETAPMTYRMILTPLTTNLGLPSQHPDNMHQLGNSLSRK